METSRIELHKWQIKAWNSKKRFVFLVAGVQSGKTTLGSIWIVNEAMQKGRGDYIIVAPTYKMLQQSTLQKFQELVPKGWGIFNKADSTYKTRTGINFFLRSADKPESIEGITAQAIWADEASLMKPDIWVMMQGRVSRTQGRILCTFTPISLNWVHKEIEKDKERRLRGEEGDIDFIQFRSVDSPYFPKEEYERAKRMLTPTQFRLRYEGIFGKAEGLIYADFCNHNIIDDFDIPNDWRRGGGIDQGYNNPFVVLDGALDDDDVLYIYKEHYERGRLLEEHAKHLDSKITYEADPSKKQQNKELQHLGFVVVPANNDVDMGILKVNARIRPVTDDPQSVRLKIFKSCIHLIDEFSLYRYDEDKEKPVKEDDHAMDALRYLVMRIDKPEVGITWI